MGYLAAGVVDWICVIELASVDMDDVCVGGVVVEMSIV